MWGSPCVFGLSVPCCPWWPLCSAEIGITFPRSGAHYYFLKRCFGNLISFLNLWTALFLGPGLAASQALLLAVYSIEPFLSHLLCSKAAKEMSGISHIVDCGNSEFLWCERGDLASDSQPSAENGHTRPYFPEWSGAAGERKEGECRKLSGLFWYWVSWSLPVYRSCFPRIFCFFRRGMFYIYSW